MFNFIKREKKYIYFISYSHASGFDCMEYKSKAKITYFYQLFCITQELEKSGVIGAVVISYALLREETE
jgi:hypothetical protein